MAVGKLEPCFFWFALFQRPEIVKVQLIFRLHCKTGLTWKVLGTGGHSHHRRATRPGNAGAVLHGAWAAATQGQTVTQGQN